MEYRREIDGLRAVAVLPVIAFHAGFDLFKGGFIGVDVFFVISGYLITGLLIGDIEAGRFSLLRFYERRARRILPALFAVMAVTVPFAFAVMLPDQFADFGRSLVAVSLFSSNILFWRESGYFDTVSTEKPLLHTWSLAVEEQFYLLFPLVLMVLWRLGRRRTVVAVAIVALLSLAFSEVAWRLSPSGNFFLAPSRAWELMVGALAAFAENDARVRRGHGLLAGFGLAMVLGTVFFYDEQIPFPSLYALLPVAGTALVILFARPGTLIATLLSRREAVGIGLISYSAYLWHQPLFALMRIADDQRCSCGWVMAGLSLASLGLAALTWKYVEQPFRSVSGQPPRLPGRNRVFAAAGAGGVLFAAIGLFVATDAIKPLIVYQLPARFAAETRPPIPSSACPGFVAIGGDVDCRVVGTGSRKIVLWGDSHLLALSAAIRPEPGISYVVLNHPGCPPITGVWRRVGETDARNCEAPDTLANYADYLAGLHPEAYVLVARWSLYLRGWHRRGRAEASTYYLTDALATAENLPFSAESSTAAVTRRLRATIDDLAREAPVVLVSQPPDLQFASDRQRIFIDRVPRATIDAWLAPAIALVNGAAAATSAHVIDSEALFCDKESCAIRDGDRPLYRDDNHLSPLGADRLWTAIRAELRRLNLGATTSGWQPTARAASGRYS